MFKKWVWKSLNGLKNCTFGTFGTFGVLGSNEVYKVKCPNLIGASSSIFMDFTFQT